MKTIKTVNHGDWKLPELWARVPEQYRKPFEVSYNVNNSALFMEEKRPVLLSESIEAAIKAHAEQGQIPASEVWRVGRDYESRVIKMRVPGSKSETRLTFRLSTGGGARGEDWQLVRVQKGYPCR